MERFLPPIPLGEGWGEGGYKCRLSQRVHVLSQRTLRCIASVTPALVRFGAQARRERGQAASGSSHV